MRKITLKFFALLCAVFAYQGAMAQLEHSFDAGTGDFTLEGTNVAEVWKYTGSDYTADGYKKVSEESLLYLVSPEITLKENNILSFTYSSQYFAPERLEKDIKASIRLIGGEWTFLEIPNLNGGSSTIISSGDIVIPADYNGKKVQVAVVYGTNGGNSSGILHVTSISVKGEEGAAPVEKVDPAIAFDVTEVAYTMGEEFTAPVLANPNNVAVTYSSSDETVATVDAEGIVTVLAEGVTTIKAVSAETESYNAGEASYVLTVTKAAAAEPEVLFEETFANNLGAFTEENADGSDGFWKWNFITHSAYATGNKDSRLVSPEIQLLTNNTISLSYRADGFSDLSKQVSVSVREVGGAWEDIVLPVLNNDAVWTDVEIAIPESYNNKKVQIAARFSATEGTLGVKNLVVKGVKGAAPVEKADPQISFEVTEISYSANDEVAFVAPELSNPNNVEVAYSSSDEAVATVDALTGEVTFVAEGVVTITATSVETEEFKSATASYTITYTIPTGIEGITADSLKNGKVYNLQGVRVDKLVKGIYIVNGKKVVIK